MIDFLLKGSFPGQLVVQYTDYCNASCPQCGMRNSEKILLFSALFDVIPSFRKNIRIFSPRSSLSALIKQYANKEEYPYPCRGGREFFFIDAKNGDTFPCGYRGDENLGKFWELTPLNGSGDDCRRCDWGCFRDPSELLGPIKDITRRPLSLVKRFMDDRDHMKLWLQDIRYYKACNFFNGRTPPDFGKMSRFSPN